MSFCREWTESDWPLPLLQIILVAEFVLFTGDVASAEVLMLQNNKTGQFQTLAKPVHPTILLETARRLLSDGAASGSL